MGNPIEFRELLVKMHTERMTTPWGAYGWGHKKPIWNGVSEVGKTILINGEAGIGDELFGAKMTEIEKIILIDVPSKIYPDLRKIFIFVFENSGFKEVNISEKVDFQELYNRKKIQ